MEAGYVSLGIILILAGLCLAILELFIPHGGAIAVVAIASISIGVVLTFMYDLLVGMLTLLGVFVALPVVISMALYYWPHTPMGRKFILSGTDAEATVAAIPAHQSLERLKGRVGKTLSPLRPAGVVDFDGRRVDTLTEGMMVEAGQLVRCIDVRAGKVIVRPTDSTKNSELEEGYFN